MSEDAAERLSTDSDSPDAETSTYCIVTGANSGIGYEISRGLLKRRGTHVVMACRNMVKCAEKQKLLQSLPETAGTCECAHIDLEDFSSVRSFAAQQKKALVRQSRKLDVLVNNAGIFGPPNLPDGTDRHMLANHYGPFLLTRCLLPVMGPGSRIVNVSSRAHYGGKVHFGPDGRLDQQPTWWWPQYQRSKLANVLFTAELQRRYGLTSPAAPPPSLASLASRALPQQPSQQQPTSSSPMVMFARGSATSPTFSHHATDAPQPRGLIATAVSPGPVNTPIFNQLPGAWLIAWMAPWILRTPEQGAKTAIYAARTPDIAVAPPLFLHDEWPMEASMAARDPELAEALWRDSEAAVGWSAEDGQI